MNDAQKDYIDYIERVMRMSTETMEEINQKLIVRNVGRYYGCTEEEMNEAVIEYVKEKGEK